MEPTVFKIFDHFTKDYSTYRDSTKTLGDIWIINPSTLEWAICYYPPTNYLWFNHELFSNAFKILSLNIPDDSIYVKKWVEYKLKVVIDNNYHPDYLKGHYDFRKDFDLTRKMSRLKEMK